MGIMSPAPPRRGYAVGLLVAFALLVVTCVAPSLQATPPAIAPTAMMTVTVVMNKAGYLSGDVASANAIVYRTPGPTNYTYTWTVRDAFNRLLNTTINGTATYPYAIPLNYTGLLSFAARVDDGQGLTITSQKLVLVNIDRKSTRLNSSHSQ